MHVAKHLSLRISSKSLRFVGAPRERGAPEAKNQKNAELRPQREGRGEPQGTAGATGSSGCGQSRPPEAPFARSAPASRAVQRCQGKEVFGFLKEAGKSMAAEVGMVY